MGENEILGSDRPVHGSDPFLLPRGPGLCRRIARGLRGVLVHARILPHR